MATSASINEIIMMPHQLEVVCKFCTSAKCTKNGHLMICASRPAHHLNHFRLKAPQLGLGSVEPVWEKPWTYCFQCVWGPQCIGVCQRSPSSCEYSRKQREKQLCSLKPPQGTDVSLFHDWKSPPERDNKVTLTWQFPAVLLRVSTENTRKTAPGDSEGKRCSWIRCYHKAESWRRGQNGDRLDAVVWATIKTLLCRCKKLLLVAPFLLLIEAFPQANLPIVWN